MPCDLQTVLAEGCSTEIGLVDDELMLLRVIAQLSAEQLLADVPGTDVSLSAILARSCTSNIGKLTDPIQLLVVIAQNGCDSTA